MAEVNFTKTVKSVTNAEGLLATDTVDPDHCVSLLRRSLKKKAEAVKEAIEGFNMTPEQKERVRIIQGHFADIDKRIGQLDEITDIQTTRTLTDDDKEKLIQVIDDQISRDRIMMKLELNGEDEEFHNALQSFCINEIQMLEDIKETIESGYIPTNQQLEPYVALHGADYLWLQEKLATDEVTDAISGFFED